MKKRKKYFSWDLDCYERGKNEFYFFVSIDLRGKVEKIFLVRFSMLRKTERCFSIFDPQMFHVKHYKQIFISDIIYL